MTYWDLLGWGLAIFVVALFAIFTVAIVVSLIASPKRPGRRTASSNEETQDGYAMGFYHGKQALPKASPDEKYRAGYSDGEAARFVEELGEGND